MWSGFRRSGQPLKGREPVGLETRRLHDVANNAGSNFKTIADASFAAEQYGLAVKNGNADLLAKLNKGLVEVKSADSYNTIYAKYFGAAAAAAASR